MSYRLKVEIKGIDSALKNLEAYINNQYKGLYIYPVFLRILPHATVGMVEFTEYLISLSKGDYVKEALNNLKDYSDKGFQEELRRVLESWGQDPPLTSSPLYARKKLGVGDTPRNIVTGEYIGCFGLGFSKVNPTDIESKWVRQL